jgi:hypothetical protein
VANPIWGDYDIQLLIITAQRISMPLDGIALDQAISDYNNRMITLSKFSFPLSDASFRKWDLLKKCKLIILSD